MIKALRGALGTEPEATQFPVSRGRGRSKRPGPEEPGEERFANGSWGEQSFHQRSGEVQENSVTTKEVEKLGILGPVDLCYVVL